MEEKKKVGRPAKPIEAGERFGKLITLNDWYVVERRTWQLVQCDCGERKHVLVKNLRKGVLNSCGCLKVENINRVREERLRRKREGK